MTARPGDVPFLPKGLLFILPAMLLAAAHASAEVVEVSRGNIELFVEEEGELQAARSISIGVQTRGTITFLAPEGSRVKKGDLLIELDSTEIEDRISRRENDLEASEKRLKELREKLAAQEASLQLQIEKARTSLEVARLRLQNIKDQPADEDLQLALKNLEDARLSLQDAQRRFETTRALFRKNYATKADLDASRFDFQLARIELERRQKIYDRVASGPDPIALEQAELALLKARLRLKKAELARDAAVPALEQSISWEEASLTSIRNRLREDRKTLERHKVFAPAPGTVVYHTFYQTRQKFQVGNRIWPGIAVLELPDTSRIKIRSKIPESAIRRVGLGDPAEVRVATIPGETFPARISWIDHWARDRNADLSDADRKREGRAGTKVFDVEAEITRSDPRLKMGLKAVLRIHTRTLSGVLRLDRKAVRTGPDGPFVIVMENGSPAPRAVKLGAAGPDYVEVLSGLRPGEKVLLP